MHYTFAQHAGMIGEKLAELYLTDKGFEVQSLSRVLLFLNNGSISLCWRIGRHDKSNLLI